MSAYRRRFDPPPIGRPKTPSPRTLRSEQQELARRLRAQGMRWVEIAVVFMERYRLSALVAMRQARGLSQPQVAAEWCRRWPDDPKSSKAISYWETWRNRQGRYHGPSLPVLDRLAQIYECRAADLMLDLGDHSHPADPRDDAQSRHEIRVDQSTVRSAFARAEKLETEVLTRWPHAWKTMDHLRRQPPGHWPDWCLLPSSAAQMVIGASASNGRPAPVGAVSALYAWRFTRSVYVFEPDLAVRLLKASPHELAAVEPFVHLPQWCVYVAMGQVGWPGAGLWAYLNHDALTGRPQLCLLLDLNRGGLDTLIHVPVYLDRRTLTLALNEMRTALKGKTRGRHHPAVKRWQLDGSLTNLADAIDRVTALVAYLSQPRADIVAADGTNTRPTRGQLPVERRRVWAVGWRAGADQAPAVTRAEVQTRSNESM